MTLGFSKVRSLTPLRREYCKESGSQLEYVTERLRDEEVWSNSEDCSLRAVCLEGKQRTGMM